jgi:hypothetical protein
VKLRIKLSPAFAELCKNNPQNSGHYIPLQRPRAAHTPWSDQFALVFD